MARIRTIKPEFRTSSSAKRVSRDARLTFLLLLTEADDEGRFVATPKYLAGSLYPHDDDVTQKRITTWVSELEQVDWVRLYRHDEVLYGVVTKFTLHQKVSHPTASRLPRPPEHLTNDSGTPPEDFPPDLGTRNREQGSSSSEPLLSDPEEEEVRKEAQKRLRNRRGEPLVSAEAWLRKTEDGIRRERREARAAQAERQRVTECVRCGGRGFWTDDEDLAHRCDHQEAS